MKCFGWGSSLNLSSFYILHLFYTSFVLFDFSFLLLMHQKERATLAVTSQAYLDYSEKGAEAEQGTGQKDVLEAQQQEGTQGKGWRCTKVKGRLTL